MRASFAKRLSPQLNVSVSALVRGCTDCAVDRAAMDAAWGLGAWDVQRAEHAACSRPGADSREALECLQAFGAFPYGLNNQQLVVADAPDTDELIEVAARHGYLMWLFRPVRGGIWAEYADDATLNAEGRRDPPCPHRPIAPVCEGKRRTIYRFGISGGTLAPHRTH